MISTPYFIEVNPTCRNYCQFLIPSQVNYTKTWSTDHHPYFPHAAINRCFQDDNVTPGSVWEQAKGRCCINPEPHSVPIFCAHNGDANAAVSRDTARVHSRPFMRRDTCQRSEPRATYRVRNWTQYNAGLIARGDIAVWIDKNLLTPAPAADVSRRGRPIVYPDAVIQGLLLRLKQVFDLPLRALQGFAQSLPRLAFPNLSVPSYTTLSRRAQSLQVISPALRPGDPLHLAVDSTGLKLYGESEWKVRTPSATKVRVAR